MKALAESSSRPNIGPARKSKAQRFEFEVTIEREVRHSNVLTVEAATEDEAREIAVRIVDEPANERGWSDDSVIDQWVSNTKRIKSV